MTLDQIRLAVRKFVARLTGAHFLSSILADVRAKIVALESAAEHHLGVAADHGGVASGLMDQAFAHQDLASASVAQADTAKRVAAKLADLLT